MSLTLSKRFDDAPREIDYPLEEEIFHDRPVRVSRVHRGCVVWLFGERYLIHLLPTPLHESKVIMAMDWLSPNGGELVIHGEGAQHGPTLCSIARVRRYMQHGYSIGGVDIFFVICLLFGISLMIF